TTFRITPEALGKAAGQVRCGRCACVFDAYTALTEHETAPEQPGAQTGPAGESVPVAATGVQQTRTAEPAASTPASAAADRAASASAAPERAAPASPAPAASVGR